MISKLAVITMFLYIMRSFGDYIKSRNIDPDWEPGRRKMVHEVISNVVMLTGIAPRRHSQMG